MNQASYYISNSYSNITHIFTSPMIRSLDSGLILKNQIKTSNLII